MLYARRKHLRKEEWRHEIRTDRVSVRRRVGGCGVDPAVFSRGYHGTALRAAVGLPAVVLRVSRDHDGVAVRVSRHRIGSRAVPAAHGREHLREIQLRADADDALRPGTTVDGGLLAVSARYDPR